MFLLSLYLVILYLYDLSSVNFTSFSQRPSNSLPSFKLSHQKRPLLPPWKNRKFLGATMAAWLLILQSRVFLDLIC